MWRGSHGTPTPISICQKKLWSIILCKLDLPPSPLPKGPIPPLLQLVTTMIIYEYGQRWLQLEELCQLRRARESPEPITRLSLLCFCFTMETAKAVIKCHGLGTSIQFEFEGDCVTWHWFLGEGMVKRDWSITPLVPLVVSQFFCVMK